jgi:hypothetical protein
MLGVLYMARKKRGAKLEEVEVKEELVSPTKETAKEKYYIKGKVSNIASASSYFDVLVTYTVKNLETGEEKAFSDWIFLPRYWLSRSILVDIMKDLTKMRINGEYEPDKLGNYEFEFKV